MKDFSKIINPGHGEYGQVYCTIDYKDGKLSICGVEGPLRGGNANGGAGQIVDHVYTSCAYLEIGWTPELLRDFIATWNRWHLNDCRAGSPAQEEWLRWNPIEFKYPETHYDKACNALAKAGLNPDPYTGHMYGHAWLTEPVPEEILQFLKRLPETTRKPAWC